MSDPTPGRAPRCGQGAPDGTCDARPALLMPRGYRCEQHRPAVPTPDPTRTLAALKAAAGIKDGAFSVGRTVLDNRAEAKGQRVSVARRAQARGDNARNAPKEN